MGDLLKTNFCRLCLNISAQVVALENDNLLSTALGSILPGMKLDIVQAPKICSSCVEKLELAVSFKKMVLLSKHKIESNTCVENIADLCRFCLIQKHDTTLLFYDNNSNSSELVKSMIEAATAQSNLNNEKPLMCTHCWSVVKDIYSFKNHCLNTEIKLQNLYKHNHNSLSSLTKEQVFNMILEVTKHIDVSVDQEIISTINSKDHCKTDENEVNSANHVESMIVIDYLKNEASQEIATGTCDILIQKEESDSESEIFEDMLNDHDVVEIRIKKPKRKNTPLCLVPSVVDDNSETKRIRQCSVLLNRIKQEIMEEEISIEEHPVECKPLPSNLEYCEVILDTSYRRKRPAASVAPKKPFTIKHEPPERPVYTNAPQPKRKGFEKSLRIDLIDCVLYKNSTWRYIECGECDFVTPSKEIMSGHMKKHVMYSKTGFKCPNCQDVYPNPEELEDHIDNCKDGSRRSRSSKSLGARQCPKGKFTTCSPHTYKQHILHLNKIKYEKTAYNFKLAAVKSSEATCNTTYTEQKESASTGALIYQCHHCSYKSTCHSIYKSHYETVHGRTYICDVCHKGFKAKEHLRAHDVVHCTEKNFSCDICEKTFKTNLAVRRHLRSHSDDRNYICDVCRAAFKSSANLYNHKLLHVAESRFFCEFCRKAFKRLSDCNKHKLIHATEKKFVCDICQKRFKTSHLLHCHSKIHCDQKNFVCGVCQKRFKTRGSLYGHQLRHGTARKFVCVICEKRFKTANDRKKHQVVHCVEKNYICHLCQKGYRSRCVLKAHLLRHQHGKRFACDICQKKFRVIYDLNKHKAIHSRASNFICDICRKGFKCRAYLQCHKILHRPEKSFLCDVCQKGFKLNSNRRQHQNRCGVVCYHCQTRFRSKVELRKHVVVH